jgi:signal peptidase II
MRARYVSFAVAVSVALAFDQLSKAWARHVLLPIYPRTKALIPGYWEFRYSENPGALFGFLRGLPGANWLFAVVALGISIGAVVWLRRAELRHPVRIAAELGLIIGGALGNAVDRIAFGHVTDFVVWKVGRFEWHTFNVADAALVIGIALLLIDSRRPRTRPATAS